MSDPFNIDKEIKIIDSNIRNIFTPHQPIQKQTLFYGRKDEVIKIIETMNTPGLHFLLYGERGVGKSSLGNIVMENIIQRIYKGCSYVKRCDKQTSYEEIFQKPLADAGFNIFEASTVINESESGNIGVDLKFFKVGIGDGCDRQVKSRPNSVSPSFIAEKLEHTKGILFIDEFDALQTTTKEKVGEVIKLLSDCGSKFKLLVVGIGSSIRDLLKGNASISRHVRQIKLNRMSNTEIERLVRKGFKSVNLDVTNGLVERIVEISSGYPHFAHLLSLKAGENAIRNDFKIVTEESLLDSINESLEDAEEYLKTLWNTNMFALESQVYVQVLLACASFTTQEFRAKQLREKINELFGLTMNQVSLNQYLTKLVADDEDHILHRISKGIYRFSDPRMPSFVKLQGINRKLLP